MVASVLQVTTALIVPQGHERLLDQGHHIRRLGIFRRRLTIDFHVCNHTFACNDTCNRRRFTMNTTQNSQSRLPGYWFGVIEHTLRAKMRENLADLGLRRGSWRILHTLADGPATAEDIVAKLPPRRDGKGRRGHGRRGHGFGPDFGAGRRPGFGPRFGPRFGFASDDERRAFFDKKRKQHGFAPFASAEEQHAFFTGMRAARFSGGGGWRGYGHAEHHDHHHDGHDGHGHHHPDHDGHHDHHDHGHGNDEHSHGHDPHGHGHGHDDGHGHGHDDEHGRNHDDEHGHGHGHDDVHGRGHGHDHHGHWSGMRAGRAESILDAFSERGWVTITDGVAVLTPEGRAAHDDAYERIRKLRSSVADGISADDYATTMATLEAMARNLGWDEPKREADTGPEA
jgi:hypothetical protein